MSAECLFLSNDDDHVISYFSYKMIVFLESKKYVVDLNKGILRLHYMNYKTITMNLLSLTRPGNLWSAMGFEPLPPHLNLWFISERASALLPRRSKVQW